MIGKTALAIAAAAAVAATAALLVWAAGFALYALLQASVGTAGAAALTALAAAIVLGAIFVAVAVRADMRRRAKEREEALAAAAVPAFLAPFAHALADKPLVTVGISMLAGLIATRNPALLRDLIAALAVVSPLTQPDD